jgi:large subunit ribosomal protein L2
MKKYKPTTPSRRGMTSKDYSLPTKKKPEKKLTKPLKKKAGRGNLGRITVRHKGGGRKRLYRMVDFNQKRIDVKAKVVALEYDPNRTAFISLIEYPDGEKRYILAPHNIKVGDEIEFSEKAPISIGNRMKLKNVPVGTGVYNVEMRQGEGGKIVRGAGTTAIVLAHENKFCHLKMPSTEVRKISEECFASIGEVSCPEHRFINIGKAGRKRHKGIRPTVRGSAMGAHDHPHGGGEGRAPIGLKYPKTPWGKIAIGGKTRKKKASDKHIIQRRKKRK